jgi:hypothetical protein
MHRTNAYPSVGHLPPANNSQAPNVSTASMGYGGGYTLPPTAAYFPVGTYSTLQAPSGPQQTTILEMQHDGTAMTQPNTPDLLMHRRQVTNLPLNSKLNNIFQCIIFIVFLVVYAHCYHSSEIFYSPPLNIS